MTREKDRGRAGLKGEGEMKLSRKEKGLFAAGIELQVTRSV